MELRYELKMLSQKEIDEKTGFIVTSYMIRDISGPTYEQLNEYLKEEPAKLFRKLVYQQGPNLILRTENETVILISNEMKSFQKNVLMDLIRKTEQYIKQFKEQFTIEMNRLKTVRKRTIDSVKELGKMNANLKLKVENFEF